MTTPPRTPTPPLIGPRHIQILQHIANGHTNEQIGLHLGMATDTVAGHLARTYRALGARDRAHAVAIGIYHGYIPLDTIRCTNGQPPPDQPPTAPVTGWKPIRQDIADLLLAGVSEREIARRKGVMRKTVARNRRKLNAAQALAAQNADQPSTPTRT